jgi:hypothetical protein
MTPAAPDHWQRQPLAALLLSLLLAELHGVA